jgi:putative transposase
VVHTLISAADLAPQRGERRVELGIIRHRLLGTEGSRSNGGPDHRSEQPAGVAVDETAVKIGTEQHWLYAAIDVETKLLLGVWISPRRGTDPAAEFLGRLAEKHDLSEATFLVDGMGYLTALARCRLSGHLNYVERNLIEKWFQTLAMRIDRFHQTWMRRRVSAQRWLTAFVHY